jgi:outer membrane immunogenic protein
MKRLLLSTAALALLSTAAIAADLPVYEPAPVVAPVPDMVDWSGFYIGLHGGYGWSDLDGDDDDFDFDDADLQGPVFGGQVGINWQYNWVVFGVEADGSWSGINDEEDFDLDDDEEEFGYEWLASFRGRLGVGLDRILLYGTGGVGFGSFEDGDIADDDDEVDFGWVAGGGAEFLVTDNVSIGAEYLHYEFEDTIDDGIDGGLDTDVDVIRGRVNVKFNSLFGG